MKGVVDFHGHDQVIFCFGHWDEDIEEVWIEKLGDLRKSDILRSKHHGGLSGHFTGR